MDEIILHHYPPSPVSEKVRVALGIKGLSWRSVEIPRLPRSLDEANALPEVLADHTTERLTPREDRDIVCFHGTCGRVMHVVLVDTADGVHLAKQAAR